MTPRRRLTRHEGAPTQAVATDQYGGPDVLEVRDVADPKVGPDAVLVRVQAASLNPVDHTIVHGALDAAFPAVWPLVPGWDVVGEVVAIGPALRHVEVGDQVMGHVRKDHLDHVRDAVTEAVEQSVRGKVVLRVA